MTENVSNDLDMTPTIGDLALYVRQEVSTVSSACASYVNEALYAWKID